MKHPSEQLPAPIRDFIRGFVRRRHQLQLVRAAGSAVVLTLAWALAWCLLDRGLQLSSNLRAAALLLNGVAVAALLYRPIRNLFRPIDWIESAWEIESRHRGFHQRLMTVVSQALAPQRHRASPELVNVLIRQVVDQVAECSVSRLLDKRALTAPWTIAVALWAVLLALWPIQSAGLPQLLGRYLLPLSDAEAVTTTRLRVRPGNAEVFQGRPVEIVADAERLGDAPVELHLSSDGRHWTRQTMSMSRPQQYRLLLPQVDADLRYFVTGGDARSRQFVLRVLRRPVVTDQWVRYEHAAEPVEMRLQGEGPILAPVGSNLVLTIRASEPLRRATFLAYGRRLAMEPMADDRSFRVRFQVEGETSSTVELLSERGVTAHVAGGQIRTWADPRSHSSDAGPVGAAAGDAALRREAVRHAPPEHRDALEAYFRAVQRLDPASGGLHNR